MLKIKLFAALAFLAFAAGVFLLAGGGTHAQTGKNDKARGEILESVAGYRQWKEVRKPEPENDPNAAALNPRAVLSTSVTG